MAPRATWKGYMKLSLVSCPVRLYNATSSTGRIAFNMLHKDTHNRVQMKPHDPELGQVERGDLVKGYAFEKDRYVIIDDEDLEKIQIESTKTITIDSFIDAAEVDPMYLDAPYYVAPDGPVADETYRVILQAMAKRNKAAVARVVLSNRERMVLLTVRDKGMVMTTLRNASEVRGVAGYFDDVGDEKLDPQMLKLAEMIIDQHEAKFDPSQFVDKYQLALKEVVKAKVNGTAPVIAKAPERGKVINLMDALKRSLNESESKKPPARSKPRSKQRAGAKPKTAAKSAGRARKTTGATRARKSA